MAVFRLDARKALAELQQVSDYLVINEALDIAGEMVLDSSQQAFRDSQDPVTGAPWPRLKAGTIRRRRKRGRGAQILMDTGLLRRSLGRGGPQSVWRRTGSERLEVGTVVRYGVYHQSNKPRKVIPRRRFLGVNRQVGEAVLSVVRVAVERRLRG
jgi:phage gpG-like protein